MNTAERAELIEALVQDGFTFIGVKRSDGGGQVVWLLRPGQEYQIDVTGPITTDESEADRGE